MSSMLRVSFASALMLTCVDGHAKVGKHCIVALEARETTSQLALKTPKSPCPVAVGYVPRSRSTATAPVTQPWRSDQPTVEDASNDTIHPLHDDANASAHV